MKKAIASFIIFQIMLVFFISSSNQNFTWDETAYILNAQYYAGHLDGNDLMVNYLARERHPGLPWMGAFMLLFNLDVSAIFLIVPVFYILFIYLAYLTGNEFFGKKAGLYSAFFIAFSMSLLSSSVKFLPNVPGALLFSLSMLLYYRGLHHPKYFLPAGFVSGLSIVVYDMNFFIIPALLVFYPVFCKKINRKYFLSGMILMVAALAPYFLSNFLIYGNPLARIIFHTEMVTKGIGFSYSLESTKLNWLVLMPVFISVPVFILFLHNLKRNLFKKRDDKTNFLYLWILIPAISIVLLVGHEPRYVLFFIIPVYILAVKELTGFRKTNFIISIAVILVFSCFMIYNIQLYQANIISNDQKQIYDYLLTHSRPNDTISTNSVASNIAYHTKRLVLYSDECRLDKCGYCLFEKPNALPIPHGRFNMTPVIENQHYALFAKS